METVQVKPGWLRALVWFVPLLAWLVLLVGSVVALFVASYPVFFLIPLAVAGGLAVLYAKKTPPAWKLSRGALGLIIVFGGLAVAAAMVLAIMAAVPGIS